MIWIVVGGVALLYVGVWSLGAIAGAADRDAERMARREAERQRVNALASWNRNAKVRAVVEERAASDFIDWRQVSG